MLLRPWIFPLPEQMVPNPKSSVFLFDEGGQMISVKSVSPYQNVGCIYSNYPGTGSLFSTSLYTPFTAESRGLSDKANLRQMCTGSSFQDAVTKIAGRVCPGARPYSGRISFFTSVFNSTPGGSKRQLDIKDRATGRGTDFNAVLQIVKRYGKSR